MGTNCKINWIHMALFCTQKKDFVELVNGGINNVVRAITTAGLRVAAKTPEQQTVCEAHDKEDVLQKPYDIQE